MTDETQVSIQSLEADLAARRDRLAGTVDELTSRLTPRALIAREKEAIKARIVAATTTPEGELRVERLAAVVAAVVVIVSLRVWSARRRHRR